LSRCEAFAATPACSGFFRRKVGAQVVFARTKSTLPITAVDDVDTVSLQVIGRL
jgi:hypothetical protein